jgi:hypothetical protein
MYYTPIASFLPVIFTLLSPLSIAASTRLRLQYSFLYSEHINHIQVFGFLPLPYVRNIFKILGFQERDDTTQRSIGKAKFTSVERYTTGSLGIMHTRQEVCRGFI